MLTHDTAIAAARKVSEIALATATENDEKALFPEAAVAELGASGLLGLTLPKDVGGSGLGPRTFSAVAAVLAEADPSLGMIYTMHVSAAACFVAGREKSPNANTHLRAMAEGKHLTTLAFSEKGSRSHFWAPVSKVKRTANGVELSAYKSWVTSAGKAQSYVVSAQSPNASGPTDTVLYWVNDGMTGLRVAAPWNGMGMRSNAASPMTLEDCPIPDAQALTGEGEGFKTMLEVVLPTFCLGSASVSLGLCRATVARTAEHLKTARFDHLGATLGEALPNLRASLASMQITTDGLAARISDLVDNLEKPSDVTVLRVLETKAAAGETSIEVTQAAMRTCGGAAFSRHTAIERYFRDAQASAVMAPTADVLRDLIGKALLGLPLF